MANVKALQTKKKRLELNLVNFEKDAGTKQTKLQEAHDEKVKTLNKALAEKIETMESSLEEAKVKAQGSEEKKVKIEAELQKTKDEIKVEADALRAQLKELEGVNDDVESLGEDDQEPETDEGGLV